MAFKYYAFISYTRDDLSVVWYIQRFLEHFRYPDELVAPELQPKGEKFLRKVFVDKTDLSARTDNRNGTEPHT